MKTQKGYKVTTSDFTSKHGDIKWEAGKIYKHEGEIQLCGSGFHFCKKAQHCFNYYEFNPDNHVFEVEASGSIIDEEDKSVCSEIKLIREIPWQEVLVLANDGVNNTGHSNSGNRNSGNWNSGDWNSGDSNSGYSNSGNWNSGNRNSGNWNSGYSNSGNWNSGNWNSGNRNSGNWNSGYRNSGDSNSGYRNSGAFCTDPNPVMYLFNKPTKMTVKEWENHKAVEIMSNLDPTIWVPENMMSDEEKKDHPKYETIGGYLKTITLKEAWANLWGNLTDDNKKVFTNLPNFDANIFFEITGIKI